MFSSHQQGSNYDPWNPPPPIHPNPSLLDVMAGTCGRVAWRVNRATTWSVRDPYGTAVTNIFFLDCGVPNACSSLNPCKVVTTDQTCIILFILFFFSECFFPSCRSKREFNSGHGSAGSEISDSVQGNRRHHRMLWTCCAGSSYSMQKPIASAISPWEAMTWMKPESADPANPWLRGRFAVGQ